MLTDAELDHRAEVARLDGNYLALELIRELRQLHTRVESMAAAVAGLADEMEHDVSIVEQHRSARERGGQHVGTGGRLGAVPPSGLIAIRRYARDLRAALDGHGGAK